MRIALLIVFAALCASAQTNPVAGTGNSPALQSPTNQVLSAAERFEKIRLDCIASRRIICGKIIKVLPDGLVVESGYTNLMRSPLEKSWLIPGTVTASRAAGLVEANQAGAVCVGTVFLADLPKGRGAAPKPQLYDYVNLEGFPVGEYTYSTIGDIHHTVREFTTKLENAAHWHFDQSEATNAPAK